MKKCLHICVAVAIALLLGGCTAASVPSGSSPDSTEGAQGAGSTATGFSVGANAKHATAEGVAAGSAASSESAGQSAQNESDPKPLDIVDSAYVIQDGYVHYVVAINNPNSNHAAAFATISTTGRAADGTISFSEEWVVGTLLPGTTTYWASMCGNGTASNDDDVTFEVSTGDSDWEQASALMNGELYQFVNVSTKRDRFGSVIAAGEITLLQEVSMQRSGDAKRPMIVCVLKDSSGKLVAGFGSYLSKDLRLGKATAFECQSYYGPPEYEMVEMHANPW